MVLSGGGATAGLGTIWICTACATASECGNNTSQSIPWLTTAATQIAIERMVASITAVLLVITRTVLVVFMAEWSLFQTD
jgi:hypothetical protein